MSFDDAFDDGWASGLHPDDREWVMAEWNGAIAAGVEFDCEFRVVRPSGDIVWVQSHSARVLDVAGGRLRRDGDRHHRSPPGGK